MGFFFRAASRWILCYAILSLPLAHAQLGDNADPAQAKGPRDPLNRTTPQSSVLSFLEAARNEDFARATEFLNLEGVSRREQQARGGSAARTIADLLNHNGDFNLASINNTPEGDRNDDLPDDRERIFQVADAKLDIQMQRRSLDGGNDLVWLFTPGTVAGVALITPATANGFIERHLPEWFLQIKFLRTPLWRWIALLLAILATAAISKRLAWLVLRIARPLCARFDPKSTCDVQSTFLSPLRLFLSGVLFRTAIELLPLSAVGRFYLERIALICILFGVVWMCSRALDATVRRIQMATVTQQASLSRSALPLLTRIAKGALFILVVTLTLANWGFDMTTVLAGVGIGGIAIALAAQKTVENLFGGLAIITDAPVKVGDFCKFGDRVGTVEDIGLRSTRVRTLDRTVVSVPNADFSSMVLENYSRRDKIWFHPILNLRKDSTPDQVREIVQAIHQIVAGHPKAEIGNLPVRFVGVNSYSLDIEVFAYIKTSNFDEFLKIQQELMLPIMRAIADAGTALALPQETHVYVGAKSENAPTESHPEPVNV